MAKIKRGLVLSGGGLKGAFQIGALKYLLDDLDRKYDVVTGFSIGALNGALVAQGDFQKLIDLWLGLKSFRDVIGGNPRFYKGFFSMKPLEKIISSLLKVEKLRRSKTELRFSCVDIIKGELVECDKSSEPLEEWLMASASIPGAFPPVQIGDRMLVDGGVLATKPLSSAISAGADEIDVIICQPLEKRETNKKPESIIDTILRCLELAEGDMIKMDVDRCRFINKVLDNWENAKKDSNFIEGFLFDRIEEKKTLFFSKYKKIEINIIDAPSNIIGVLDVNPEKIRRAINIGYEKAKKAMAKRNKID